MTWGRFYLGAFVTLHTYVPFQNPFRNVKGYSKSTKRMEKMRICIQSGPACAIASVLTRNRVANQTTERNLRCRGYVAVLTALIELVAGSSN